jgi:hypothetical protein
MSKKIIWMVSFIFILGVLSCGGDSSKEAKDLLQRILMLVGIPQDIVVTICQGESANDFCENSKIDKYDNMKNILEKVTKNPDGDYLLDDYNPNRAILLVLKDKKIIYDDNKFVLSFDGNTLDGKYDKKIFPSKSYLFCNLW